MRAPVALAVLLAAAPAPAQSQRVAFICTGEATGAGLTAQTERRLDRRGDLRTGATTFTLPLGGTTGTLDASWDVVRGLPQVARGKYIFRLPAPANASWQLSGVAKPIRSRNGVLAIAGEQFSALLASGAPIQLVLADRDGQVRERASLDRAAFDAALDLARQADARALAKASDYRSCARGPGA